MIYNPFERVYLVLKNMLSQFLFKIYQTLLKSSDMRFATQRLLVAIAVKSELVFKNF